MTPLIDDVYAILDSKIQYLEFQIECKMEQYYSQTLKVTSTLTQNFEQIMKYVEMITESKKLLQIIKSWLREDNLSLIFDLLNGNKYLQYSEDNLENMLKISALDLLKMNVK